MNRLLLNLGLVAMEVCWLATWAALLGLWIDGTRLRQLLSPLSILALVLLGCLSTQAFGRHLAGSRWARLALAALGLAVVTIAVRFDQYPGSAGLDWLGALASALNALLGQVNAPAVAFGLGLFLWWRGVRLGIQPPSYADVESAFRWGIGLLLACVLIMAISTRPGVLPALEAQTAPFIVGFFFFSLLTLALGRLESLQTRKRALGINSQWLGVLVAVAATVVLLALLVGQLLSFDLLIAATRPVFDVLGQLLLVLIYIVVLPLAYIVEFLIYFILSLVNPDPSRQPPQPLQPGEVDNLLQRLLSLSVPPELIGVLKAVGAALLLGLALLVIARAAAGWRSTRTDPDGVREERDSLWEPDRFKRAMVAWLRNLLRRGARGKTTAAVTVAASTHCDAAPSVLSVRDLYRQLLGLGEAAGVRRLPMTTPLEHMPPLQRSLEPEEDVARLTAAYVGVRYAEQEASSAEIARLRDQLGRVHPRDAQS